MAILGKIRSKGVMLMLIVGLALFAFIIGDALTQGSTYFNKSREVVGEIAGEKINISEFQASIDQLTDVYKIETGQSNFDEEMTAQIRASVWESMVNEKILFAEAKKLGLSVGKEELSDRLIGNNIHPLVMQRRAFAGENGQFSRAALLNFLNSLETTPENDDMRQQIEQAKAYWKFWENNVKLSILQEKYNALMAKTVTANSLDAKSEYAAAKRIVDVNYVVQPYSTVPDADVKVSQSEIKDRYNKMKDQFKMEANRSIKYVVFQVKASPEDYKKAQTEMNTLSAEFTTTADVAGFVNKNSEVRYDGKPYSEATVPANLKAFAFGSPAGSVYGPVFENEAYTMARVVETGIVEADSVKLRHIFLAKSDESKTDSLIAAISSGANFAELAAKYSAVKQTAANGGEIGWIVDGIQGLDKEIITKSFASAINGVFTSKNEQGTQIFQVTEKTAPKRKVKLAVFQINVSPSNVTVSKIYNDAKQFAAELSGDEFDKKAKEKNVIVRTANDLLSSTEKVADLAQSRQVVRWAFENKKGEVSDVYDCDNNFVVATVTEVNEKGYRSIEKVTDQLKALVMQDKKAEKLIEKLKAQLTKTPSLESLATALGTDVKSAPAVSFSAYQFGVAGFEPAVVGKASILPVNKISSPVKGNAGVYVLLPMNAKENPNPFDAKMQIMMLNSRLSYSLPYAIIQDLKDKTDIVDNRLNFF
ncbi:MAG: SurA N-terminal domain-containing protein [Paludibacter sp.]